MSDNPLIDTTPPAWCFEQDLESNGWVVAVYGKPVMDAETGCRAIFYPPPGITSFAEYNLWWDQLKRTVERMSGVKT